MIKDGDRVRIVNTRECNGLTGTAWGIAPGRLPFVALDEESWFTRAGMYFADDGGALTVYPDQLEVIENG